VSGISGKVSDLEEDDVGAEATNTESSRRALLEVLGQERRDRILAALYLVRQDGVVVVRQSSIQIWKVLVHNTPRTGMPCVIDITYRETESLTQSEKFFPSSLTKLSSLYPGMNSSNRRYHISLLGVQPALTAFQTAGRTVTELCRKFGEKILSEIVPILKAKSASMDSRTREGVCLTLSALM